MTNKVNNDFLIICNEIIAEGKSEEEWAEIESDDMFQQGNYEGGFDGSAMVFCFAVFENEQEYWFDFRLSDVELFTKQLKTTVEITEADF